LSISSETRNEKEETNEKFTRREFGYSTFKRTFHIPETVNTDGINAQYTDGILTVDLPKKEEAIDKGVKQIEVL
jgi:HSP20 family protein